MAAVPVGLPESEPSDPYGLLQLYAGVSCEAVIATGIKWVTWHDLRHTFASRVAMLGVPLTTIAALLRHSTTALVRRYVHLSPAYLKEAIEEVSAFGKEENSVGKNECLTTVSDGTVTETGNEEKTKAVLNV